VRTLSHQFYGKTFYDFVMKEDPTLEGRFTIHDRQRLARALEVKWQTGKSITHFQQGAQPPRPYSYFKIFLSPPRPKLYAQINSRFETMMSSGALEEVQALVSHYGQGASTLFKAIGLRELNAYLQGEWTLQGAMSKAQQHSRNYAKRQSTWFRHQFPADLTLENADVQAALSTFTQWAHSA
jgi:tRNA dimethylallyltransferase